MQFKNFQNEVIPDIIVYVNNYLTSRKDVEILIGSDSQCYGSRKTVYGVVIALYTKGKGAHVLYKKETVGIEKNTPVRLMTEVWKAIEVAEYLTQNGLPKPRYIEIDINPDPKYKSNSVFRSAMGLISGMGYIPRCKHGGVMSTYAANNLVRS